jgi:hypothetical protein
MKKNNQSTCFWVSLLLLSLAMILWSDLYLFSKTVRLPEWATTLPSPINVAMYATFLCLIPVVLFSSTLANASTQLSKIILIASIFPILIYIFKTNSQDIKLVFNVIFQYLWVIGWSCLLPALILLGIRAIWQFLAIKLTHHSSGTPNGAP